MSNPNKQPLGKPYSENPVQQSNPRTLFYYLLNSSAYPQARSMAKQKLHTRLKAIANQVQPIKLDLNDIQAETLPTLSFDTDTLSPFQTAEIQWQSIPADLTEFCWLQRTSQASNAHTAVAASLLPIYAAVVEHGSQTLSPTLPALNSFAFAQHRQFHDWAFDHPVIALCLAQFPDDFLAEILGFTLAYTADTGKQSEAQLSRLQAHALQAANQYLQIHGQPQRQNLWQRICLGLTLYQSARRDFLDHIQQQQARSPHQCMIALLMAKAPYAQGHHKQHTLAGKKLDDWFAIQPFPAEAFLQALAHSAYIDLKTPQNSILLKQLTVFGGPMFRVFGQAELQTLHDWVFSLSQESNSQILVTEIPVPRSAKRSESSILPEQHRKLKSRTHHRQLFHHLLHIDSHPECLPLARQTALAVLNRVKRWPWLKATGYGAFFAYSHEALQTRVEQLFRQQMAAYRPPKAKPKLDKKVYIWGIEQLAPTLLVDGCWLQNIAQTDNRHTQVSKHLFRIYADEIGNGQPCLNHPNVYRNLLQSLHIQLADFDTQAFAEHPGFLDSAFDLPVYLLAISQFPKDLLPELIGLNLAIELSGLGAPYMSLIDELNYWKIDPTIVSLHLSIDNLAGGHAAIARDVVGLYLDQILMTAGYQAMQTHWQRIWTGLLSLNTATRRFRYRIIYSYVTRYVASKFKEGLQLIDQDS